MKEDDQKTQSKKKRGRGSKNRISIRYRVGKKKTRVHKKRGRKGELRRQ